MRIFFKAAILSIALVLAIFARDTATSSLDGYTEKSSEAERSWETKFRALPSVANQREYMQRLSARPHHVGSPYDKDNAEWLLARFKEWGFDAHIETFDVLFPTPKDNHLEMIEPKKFVAKLSEPALAIDPTTSQKGEQLPAYNAYSIDGDVTGPLVYVNYGMPDDYKELERNGVSVKGAIVIARYGGGWRGVKPKVAAEHGAIGCIIYSDPHDDGFSHGDVFPRGPFRPPDGVQRGSVMDTEYPGDPLTPGVAAVPGAKRLTLAEAETITKIPVLPISYGDAQPLLSRVGGPRRSAELARQPGDYVSLWSGARESASQSAIELGAEAFVRCDRKDRRRALTGSMGDPRQSSRCLGKWRRRPDLWTGY